MLKKDIQDNLNKAVKENDEIVRSTLRMILAGVANKEKEKKYKAEENAEVELNEEEMIEVISSEAKKRKEAIVGFEKGNRQELAEKEKKELKVLQEYLPKQLSEEKIRKLVQETIGKTKASKVKDIGKVMGVLMPHVKGRADGNLVNQIVKDLLKND